MAITKVYLLSVPLEKDYAHTLWFASESAQRSYFLGRKMAEYAHDDFTYQRKDGVIRVPEHIDTILKTGINYVMYQNTAYNNKWFYAFITDAKYINDGRTDITIKTDCLQTWMFEKQIKPCFVEREHAAADSVGRHTLDEGLELGEYTTNRHSKSQYTSEGLRIVIGTTKRYDGHTIASNFYNNLYSGLTYYAFENSYTGVSKIEEFLDSYDENGAGDAIACMFMAPKVLAKIADTTSGMIVPQSSFAYQYNINTGTAPGVMLGFSEGKLDGYTPRNNKLKCFPYRYLLATNNAGASVPLKYERFYTADTAGNKTIIDPQFTIQGVLCPGCSVRMVPLNYNGAARNDEEGINMGKFPALNWTSDVYTNWLTQNGVNIAIDVVSGMAQIGAGVAMVAGSGGLGAALGGGSVVGGVSQIAGTLAQIHQQSYSPPQSKGNLNSGDIVTASGENDFHFYDMSIKKEIAEIIDGYFDMYGYKTHMVKIPETNHRENYWFTKTIDANITGAIPQEDLQIIKDCYNRGITYWKTPANFKNYAVSNGTL